MTQEPKAKIMHYVCQIRKKAKSAHFFRYLRKNYVKLVTDAVSILEHQRCIRIVVCVFVTTPSYDFDTLAFLRI